MEWMNNRLVELLSHLTARQREFLLLRVIGSSIKEALFAVKRNQNTPLSLLPFPRSPKARAEDKYNACHNGDPQ